MRRLARLGCLLLTATAATPALAHQTAASRLEINVRAPARAVDVLFILPARDLADTLGLPGGPGGLATKAGLAAEKARIDRYLDQTVAVLADHHRCAPAPASTLRPAAGGRHVLWLATFQCDRPIRVLRLEVRTLFENGRYRHFARIQVGARIYPAVFSPRLPYWELRLGTAPSLWRIVGRFGWQGVRHILSGPDHILFIVCLLLVARSLKELLGVVSAFTVAHTLTLLLSALGVMTLPPRIAEPAIAATIAYVAFENLRLGLKGRLKPPHRYLVTFVFGLVHGFGFSYVLRRQLDLPTHALLPALFAFNGGVEVGQAIIVVSVWPWVRWLMGRRAYPRILVVVSAGVLAMALWWMVTRALGPAILTGPG